jgi:hypothetical protein
MHAKHALLSQCFGRNKIDMRPLKFDIKFSISRISPFL